MKKILRIIAIIILSLFVVVFLGKDMIAKTAVSAVLKLTTGLKLDIASFKIGMFNTLIDIKGLKLFNPEGFPDKLMMNAPEIYVDYDLMALFKKNIHMQKIKIDLSEFVIVKNSKGEVNIDSLKAVQESKKQQEPPKKEEPAKKSEALPFKIDVLELKIGKVIYKDYSKGGEPKITETDLNLNERFENISAPYAVTSIILFKALMNTTIGKFIKFDLGPIEKSLGGTLSGATQITKDAAKTTVDTGKKVIEGTTNTIKNILPFGKKD